MAKANDNRPMENAFGTGARRESSQLPLAVRRNALAAAARGDTEELFRRRLCVGRTRLASGIGKACVRQSELSIKNTS